jgi:hypothetical protein
MADTAAKPTIGDEGEGSAEDGGERAGLPEVDLAAVEEELAAAEEFVEEHVQRALSAYRGTLSPAVMEEVADDVRCFLLTHPVASLMLARVRPRAPRATSGDNAIMNAASGNVVAPGKDRAG